MGKGQQDREVSCRSRSTSICSRELPWVPSETRLRATVRETCVSEMACTTTEGTRRAQPVGSRKRESGLVPGMKYLLKETVPERIRR